MNTSRYGRPLIQTGETKAAEAARLQIDLSSKKAVATQRLNNNRKLLTNLQNPQVQQQIMSEQQNPNGPQNNLQILKQTFPELVDNTNTFDFSTLSDALSEALSEAANSGGRRRTKRSSKRRRTNKKRSSKRRRTLRRRH